MLNHRPVAVLILVLSLLTRGIASDNNSADNTDAELAKIVSDYTRLYTRETLPEWRKLFHTGATIASLKSDGSINVRTLETFYKAQKDYFATGRSVSERLENVSVAPGNRMARVTADFIFRDEREEKRGKLGLHLLREGRTWKIVSVVFSYD